ncbi:MAG: ParA family protein [Chloroflexota bacterium]|nr:ParA family protein [Chloroflexota bacterium]
MTRTIAVTSQKGGVAKTTTTANLGAAWGRGGRRVLCVDLDPQFALTRAFGCVPSQFATTTLEAMRDADVAAQAVHADVAPGVALMPARRELRSLELTLASEVKREEFLSRALARLHEDFDVILIDCPPNLGLLTVNALFAAREALVPVSMLDSGALQGAGEVQATIEALAARDVPIRLTAVVRTMVDSRRLASQAIDAALSTLDAPIAATTIPLRAEFQNATVVGTPLAVSHPYSVGALAYDRLAAELYSQIPAPVPA